MTSRSIVELFLSMIFKVRIEPFTSRSGLQRMADGLRRTREEPRVCRITNGRLFCSQNDPNDVVILQDNSKDKRKTP